MMNNSIYYRKYKVRGFFASPFRFDTNRLSRIINAYIEGIKTRAKIPKYVILPIDDKIVAYAEQTDLMIRWIYNPLIRITTARRDYLPEAALPEYHTHFLIAKPVSKPIWADQNGQFTRDKRRLNKALDKNARGYITIHTTNIDPIMPSDHSLFNNNGTLAGNGFHEMWLYLSGEIKQLDRELCTQNLDRGSSRPQYLNQRVSNPHHRFQPSHYSHRKF